MEYKLKIIETIVDDVSANARYDTDVLLETSADECAEIQRIEVIQPSTAGGEYLELIINDKEYGYFRPIINGDFNALPPYKADSKQVVPDFGIPLKYWKEKGVPSIFDWLTPKIGPSQNYYLRIHAGANGIDSTASPPTGPLRIRSYVWVYKKDETLTNLAGMTSFTSTVGIANPELGISATFSKNVPLTVDNFDEMPGGMRQAKPIFMPWATWARNKTATTPNKPYIFKREEGTVDESWQNLSWNVADKEAFIPIYLAVKPHANLKSVGFYIGDNADMEFPADPDANLLILGTETSEQPTFVLPKIIPVYQGKYSIRILDNGTAIPANGVTVFTRGIKIDIKA